MNKLTYLKMRYQDLWYQLKNGIKSLRLWLPAVWKDRSWDYTYIYKILGHKLEITLKAMKEAHNWGGKEEEMRHIELILNRLEYIAEGKNYDRRVGWDKHDEKWGETIWRFEDVPERPGYKTLHFDRPNVNTVEEGKKERREFRKLMKREEMLKKQDLEYALKLLRKHSSKWWI